MINFAPNSQIFTNLTLVTTRNRQSEETPTEPRRNAQRLDNDEIN